LAQAGAGRAVLATSGTGTAGLFSSTNGTALEIDGEIKVSGSKPAAFVHTATAQNITNHQTIIDNPATNDNPDAILIVTKYWTGVYDPHEIGVYYVAGKWRIFHQDTGQAMPVNNKFNILVINK
jgi:hypothetical protein